MRKGNVQLGCNECEAIYRSKMGLSLHIRSVHKGVKIDGNQCDYRAFTDGNLTSYMKKYVKEWNVTITNVIIKLASMTVSSMTI